MVATDFVLHFLRIFHIFSTWKHQQIGGFSNSEPMEPRPACASKWSSATSCCLTSHTGTYINWVIWSFCEIPRSCSLSTYSYKHTNSLAVYEHTMNILLAIQNMQFFSHVVKSEVVTFSRYPNDWVEKKAFLKPPSFTRTSNMAAWTFHH